MKKAVSLGVRGEHHNTLVGEGCQHCRQLRALLLRKTADRMDARQRKMQLEKWLLVARRR